MKVKKKNNTIIKNSTKEINKIVKKAKKDHMKNKEDNKKSNIVEAKSEQTLLKKIWEMADVMASAGIANTDYITQLTYLLFLKMDDEKENLGLNSSIKNGYKWNDLVNLSGEDLIDKYESILKELSKADGLVGTIFTKANNKISSPTKLKQIIELLNVENWYMMQGDFKGAIYESILERIGQDKKSGAGEYFTPRAVISAIVDVIKPKIGERLADPACGTGGFILEAYEYMKEQCKNSVEKQNTLKNKTFYGADIADLVVTLCSMNMYLHDIGVNESPIVCADSLLDKSGKMFDVILANPPFGTRPKGAIDVASNREEFIKSPDNQINFLQHIMSIVKTGGRVGVVMPDSVLTDTKHGGKAVREKLLKEYNLHTILRLPTGIFYSPQIKTNVLFFEKGSETKDIWYYDLRAGMNFTPKNNPLKRSDLDEFVECYKSGHIEKRKETYSEDNPNGRWRKYTIDDINNSNDLRLDFKWLKFDDEDDRTIDEVMEDMRNEISEIKIKYDNLSSDLYKKDISSTKKTKNSSTLTEVLYKYKNDMEVLKLKIIEAGISGKLTEQLESDGDAKELYNEIQKENEKILKEYKNKKIKQSININDEEIPFEIPKNWMWSKLENVATEIFAGGDRPKICSNVVTEKCNIPIYSNGEKKKGLYGYTNIAKVIQPALTISARGTIGYVELREEPFVPIVRLITITSKYIYYLKYLKFYFSFILTDSTGSSIPQLTVPMIKKLIVPLPPLAEQERIVNRISELLSNL